MDFTETGIRLLGEKLADMTIADVEALLYANKLDPLKIFQITNDFIDLAKALVWIIISTIISRLLNFIS